ncbi:MAG: protein phosphatase 2C domain-containing protein [Kofleriaceae bacterium]
MTLEAWLVTDVGVVRDHNEDSAHMEAVKGFFIVADGMGGHAAGEVASAMAVETVRVTLEAAKPEIDAFKKAPTDAGRRGIVQLLQSAVLSAHQAVFQRGQNEQDKAGMGTTLDVVLVAGPEAFVAHVGDSRTYLIREGRSSQITTDHTVAEVLVIEGKLTIEEAQVSPLRTILVNAIGVSADVGVEMAHVTLKRGDRLLLCSDGLHDYFPVEEEIAQKLSSDKPGDALADMVELAKTRGGHDNITGVAVHVTEVLENIPGEVGSESTQPVDITTNPFAADEPTETAFLAPPGLPPRMIPLPPAHGIARATQPMRTILDDEQADTLPPPEVRKATATNLPVDDKKAADKKADDKSEGDAQSTAKSKKSKKAKKAAADKKTDGEAEPDEDDSEADDGTPVEIATADTGRVTAPKAEPAAEPAAKDSKPTDAS